MQQDQLLRTANGEIPTGRALQQPPAHPESEQQPYEAEQIAMNVAAEHQKKSLKKLIKKAALKPWKKLKLSDKSSIIFFTAQTC